MKTERTLRFPIIKWKYSNKVSEYDFIGRNSDEKCIHAISFGSIERKRVRKAKCDVTNVYFTNNECDGLTGGLND